MLIALLQIVCCSRALCLSREYKSFSLLLFSLSLVRWFKGITAWAHVSTTLGFWCQFQGCFFISDIILCYLISSHASMLIYLSDLDVALDNNPLHMTSDTSDGPDVVGSEWVHVLFYILYDVPSRRSTYHYCRKCPTAHISGQPPLIHLCHSSYPFSLTNLSF